MQDNARGWLDSFAGHAAKPALALVQFNSLPDAAAKSRLKEGGISLYSFVAANTFIAQIAPRTSYTAAGIRGIVPMDARWKIAVPLQEAANGGASVNVVISANPETPDNLIRERIKGIGGSIHPTPLRAYHCYEAAVPAKQLMAMAAWEEVLYISPAANAQPLNLESQQTTKANVAHAPQLSGGYGLLGDSVTVGVGDNTSGLAHIDLRDRIVNYNPAVYTNHGQHTNGTVGGAGTVDPRGEGFAPHVKLVDELYNLVWERTGALYGAHNMTVTNNSYSATTGTAAFICGYAGTYDVYAQELDSIALQFPSVLHVFAAGNDGYLTCSPYPGSFGTIVGGYQNAKNILVVGNATKQLSIYYGSSRGPVKDGRIKPEITAVGTAVYSTKGNDTYLGANGTSMACPQMAGSAALVQQQYKRLHSGAMPSAALVKTLLMNGAMDIGNAGPDYTYGFGMADLQRTLGILSNNWYTSGSIANAASQTPLTITVPANTAQLKVMLYWNDAPASPSSAAQLINDLDLKVTDPASGIRLPYVLNPAPAHVADPATPAADHLNNVEQVVINNPGTGSYAVGVTGYNVPSGTQAYVLAYDIIPAGITVSSPFKDGAYQTGSLLGILWNAAPGSGTFTIEYSTSNGASWTTLSSSIPAGDRQYSWTPAAGINSNQCLVRVTRNGSSEQFTTGLFTINDQPQLSLNAIQCPGYVNIHWTSVPNVSGYTILRKSGYYLQPVATTTDTFYYASGLSPDSAYYFSVQPLFGAAKGYRSLAVRRQPDTGSCSGNFSDGDLMAAHILSPAGGRAATSTALTANEVLTVQVRNLDDAIAASYKVSYQLNGGAWQSQTLSGIPARGTVNAIFTGLNLAMPGTYVIRAAVQNLSAADPVPANDTVTKVLRQLQNAPVSLSSVGFLEDFESTAALTLMEDTMGFTPNEHWDFYNSVDTGRLRTFVDSEITISGNRSISMDEQYQTVTYPFNRLTGTFNIAAYSAASDELRMEFDYKLHGTPKFTDSNKVWIRGSDALPWIPLYAYDRNATPGDVIHSGTLSLSDAVGAASQAFSTSTQIAFGQRDTSTIALNDYGNGLTVDNIRLYKVNNDIGIGAVVSPAGAACAMSSATPLSITVYNGVTATISSIQLYYQLDGGTVVNETLAALAGKSSITYTFTQTMNAASFGAHTLRIWVVAPSDDFHNNDSILNYTFRNEPLVTAFPYLQNFEGSDGYWYPEGRNSSWQYGTPATTGVHKAASGTKAWKTNLTGHYNDNELSYLYSPCFDVSGLTAPMLSFSVSMEVENCGASLCDGAWVEYSAAGGAWTKLGASGQGTNWYNSAAFQLWNDQSGARWKVASIPLPTGSQPLRLRFVMNADGGTNFDGLAIDDIHIYDRAYPLYTAGAVGPLTQTVSGTAFTTFTSAGRVLAQIAPSNENLGSTDVTLYSHSSLINAAAMQYYLPKNFVVNTQNAPTDSVTARFYISDADVLALVNATGCTGCSRPEDAYELGITKYDNSNIALENGSLADNTGGTYTYIPYTRIRWVPYDSGYYAEVRVASFSEIWFNDGGPANAFPLPIASVDFDARKSDNDHVLAGWLSYVDTQVSTYELQRATNAHDFTTVATVPPVHDNAHHYTYTDAPGAATAPALYYRLKYTLRNGRAYYTAVRQVIWSGRGAALQVYPNPTPDGQVQIGWSTQPGTMLEAAVTDMTGRTVSRMSAIAADYSNITALDLGGLAKGVYFLHAAIGGERFDVKLVIR